jgi:hypothetical protein
MVERKKWAEEEVGRGARQTKQGERGLQRRKRMLTHEEKEDFWLLRSDVENRLLKRKDT